MPAGTGQLLVALLLANAPFWILSTHAFVRRAAVNLDSLLVVLRMEFSLRLGVVALVLSWAADIAVTAATTYHFGSPSEFIRSAIYAGDVHWASFLTSAAAVSTLTFLAVLAAIFLLPRPRIGIWPIAIVVAALIAIDTSNGSSAMSRHDVRAVPADLAGSSWYSLARKALEPPQEAGYSPVSGGMAEVARYLTPALASDSSVLYVIVESFDVHQDTRIRQWPQDKLFTPEVEGNYTTTYETVTSRGGTTPGEIRRPCGLYGICTDLAQRADLNRIAGTFAKAGWTTVGMHGFSESRFSRRSWWPAIGLQDIRFAEELASFVSRHCSAAFRGVCNEDLLEIAIRQTRRPHSYAYALTLNSRLPIAPLQPSLELPRLCSRAEVGDDMCALLAHVRVSLRALAKSLAAQKSPPYVIVAGDYPPPSVNGRTRDQFQRETVPFYALVPRQQEVGRANAGASLPTSTSGSPP